MAGIKKNEKKGEYFVQKLHGLKGRTTHIPVPVYTAAVSRLSREFVLRENFHTRGYITAF